MELREYQRFVNKRHNLPGQYERALKRVEHIEAELHRYGLDELIAEARKPTLEQYLSDTREIDRAWDREVEIARIQSGGNNG